MKRQVRTERLQKPVPTAPPWQRALAAGLHEITPAGWRDYGAMLGFTLGLLQQPRCNAPVLWVESAGLAGEVGHAYATGLMRFGIDPQRLIRVQAGRPLDGLWTLEEALKAKALGGVVGLIEADARPYDLTASRRLHLAAKAADQPLYLMRVGQVRKGSAAQTRWQVSSHSAPSVVGNILGTKTDYHPAWHVELVKSRDGATGQWDLNWDDKTLCFSVATVFADRQVDPQDRQLTG